MLFGMTQGDQLGPIETATAKTLAALQTVDRNAAEAALALSLSRILDRMDEDTRARMAAQTVGQLTRILDRLAGGLHVRRRVNL